jgi:hypothetical protein
MVPDPAAGLRREPAGGSDVRRTGFRGCTTATKTFDAFAASRQNNIDADDG